MKFNVRFSFGFFSLLMMTSHAALAAKPKHAKPKLVGIWTGSAFELFQQPSRKKAKPQEFGKKSFVAFCDGVRATWKPKYDEQSKQWEASWAGSSAGSNCILTNQEITQAPSKSIPKKTHIQPTAAHVNSAKSVAIAMLVPKKGAHNSKSLEGTGDKKSEGKDSNDKVDYKVKVFDDGTHLVSVAQAIRERVGNSSCVEYSSMVILQEIDKNTWKPMVWPKKARKICGYSFFTHGDIDGDGVDEIVVRVDLVEGNPRYHALKRVHNKSRYIELKGNRAF